MYKIKAPSEEYDRKIGGVQFVSGEAQTDNEWLASWFSGRTGFTVETVTAEEETEPTEDKPRGSAEMTRETLMLRAQSLLPNLPQETLEFACALVLEQICNYCNLTEAPDGLTNTAALMVRGLVNSVQLQNENMQPAAKGVSRGDTSFSFATAAEQLAALAGSGDFLTDYKAQLNSYRKMRW